MRGDKKKRGERSFDKMEDDELDGEVTASVVQDENIITNTHIHRYTNPQIHKYTNTN